MRILGPFERYTMWVQADNGRKMKDVLYTTIGGGKITGVLYPKEGVEWAFSAQDNVSLAMLRQWVNGHIEVTSWTL